MKLISEEKLKLISILTVILCLSTAATKTVVSGMINFELESESELTKLEDQQIYQSVPMPQGLVDMILAYTYVYPDDKISRVSLDRVTVENGNVVIYRPTDTGETTKVLLDIKELSWLCGKRLLCKPDEAAAKLNPKGKLSKDGFKAAIQKLYKRLGPDSTNCIGDEYNFGIIQKAVIFCFKTHDKEVEYNNLFNGLSNKDMDSASLTALDHNKAQTFLLHFSDGREALVEKAVTFKDDGLYEKDNLMFKYSELETIDGEKCQIKYKLPIAPTNFIPLKIFNKNCIARFKYNKLDTYMGTGAANCEEIIKYSVSRMKTRCLKAKNGENDAFKNLLKSSPIEATWNGWIYYHKLLDEKNEVTKLMHKLFISDSKVTILDKDGHEIRSIELKDITWPCNNDGACTIPEYMRYLVSIGKKTSIFDKLQKDMKDQWLLQDLNSCFIINEAQNHVICPSDNAEEFNMRLALSIALEKLYFNSPAADVKPAEMDSEFKIVYAQESDTTFKDYVVLVTGQGLKNKQTKMNIIEYPEIGKIGNARCAFIMREFVLPNSLHEYDTQCCTRFMGKEPTVLCIQKKSKCYIEIRKMVKLMHDNCMKVTKAEQQANGVPQTKSEAPSQNAKDILITSFKGPIMYTPLGNYKYKGTPQSFKGTIDIDSSKVLISKDDNSAHFNFNIVTIRLLCKDEYTCTTEGYKKHQSKYLQNTPNGWLENHITTFFNKNSNINQSNCSIIISTNAEYNLSEGAVVCSTEGKGEHIRAALTYCNDDALSKLKDNHPYLKLVPLAPLFSSFTVEIVSAGKTDDITKIQSTKSKILNNISGVRYKNIAEYIFEYKELYDPKTYAINTVYALDDKTVAPAMIAKKIDPKCCFKVSTSANFVFVCALTKKRCTHDKARLYVSMLAGVQAIVEKEKKENELKKLAAGDSNSKNVLDPFNFGLEMQYRKFPDNFSYVSLATDTVFNVESGNYKGWIYAHELTGRGNQGDISPVHVIVQEGKLELRTDVNKTPYETIDLSHFESICSKPCMPKDYIKAARTSNEVEDKVYLHKAITNVMGQIFKPFAEQACTIADFNDPKIGFGISWIFCTIDDLQGPKFRLSLERSIYNALRTADMQNQVKNTSWGIDKFYGILVENDSINSKFNEFITTKDGLVGSKAGSVEKYKLDYKQIRDDNYGHLCAFWYKDMKVSTRGNDFKEAIKDDNCCFRFYYGPGRKKIEICAFIPGNGVCIKKSRELMKALKNGCLQNHGASIGEDNKKKIDAFSEDTYDDNKNGIFNGFVHISDVFKSNIIPEQKPKYLKVDKKMLGIFNSSDDLEPEIKINTSDLIFSCDGYSPCSPTGFSSYAGTNKKYIPNLPAISGVYNNFRNTFSKLRKTFESDCFVLETEKVSYFVCPYSSAHATPMKKAIVVAHSLSYSCKTLSDTSNAAPDDIFNIVYRTGDGPKSSTTAKLTNNGLVDAKNNQIILSYLTMGDDPETKKKCAIWFRDVNVSFDFNHKECCFSVLVGNKHVIICLDEQKICVPHTFQLMRSIWNGCLYGMPNVPTLAVAGNQGQEIVGGTTPFKPKGKWEYDPRTNFLDIQTAKRNIPIFNPSKVTSDYMTDPDNRLMFSINKTSFQGYFNIYPIEFEDTEKRPPLQHLFGVLHGEHMKFFKLKGDKTPALEIFPHFLSMSCGTSSACSPKQFGEFISKFDKKYNGVKDSIDKKMVMYENGNNEGCVVLEHTLKNKPDYYIVCIHVSNVKSNKNSFEQELEKKSYTPARISVQSQYGSALRKIVYDSNAIARKFVDNFALPVDIEAVSRAKTTVYEKGTKVIENVNITADGITVDSKLIFKFADSVHCRVRTNPLYVPDNLLPLKRGKSRNCCMRFMGGANFEYMCVETFNCEYTIFYMARQFNERCSAKRARHFDDVYNEVNVVSFRLLPFLRKFIPEDLTVPDIQDLNSGSKALPVDQFKTKFKTIITKTLYDMRKLYHDIAVTQIEKSDKIAKGVEDNTQLDDPKFPVKGKVNLYIGQSEKFNLKVQKGRIMRYNEKNKKRYAISYNRMLFLGSKQFRGVVFDNSNSLVISFFDDGLKYFFELNTKGENRLTGTYEKLTQKSQSASDSFDLIGGNIKNLFNGFSSTSSSSTTTTSSSSSTTTFSSSSSTTTSSSSSSSSTSS